MTELPVITDAVLDQWEGSAEQDAERGQRWSTNPLAILAVVRELRAARSQPATDPAGLDVEAIYRTFVHTLPTTGTLGRSTTRREAIGTAEARAHLRRVIDEYRAARLSVADGPGPATCICGANPPRRPWTPGANGDPCRDGNGNFREGHGYVADGPGPEERP